MSNVAVKTKIIRIPKEKGKIMHDRIEVYLNMYLDNEKFKSKFRDHKLDGIDFDLKTLCYSCYIQGLVDANELFSNDINKL